MEFASYYKLPVPQTVNENCVAHNSSLVPVPGRDILVQAWYQGGVSVIDFTDSADPTEIAFFDRGPINSPFPIPDPTNPNRINLGGLWSTYWYNGFVYGSEIARGFDTFGLVANDQLSEDEITAASEVDRRVQRPAPDQVHVGTELRGDRRALRPGGAQRVLDNRTARQVGNRLDGARHPRRRCQRSGDPGPARQPRHAT